MENRASVNLCADWDAVCVTRAGVGALIRSHMQGVDLSVTWDELMECATDDAAGSGMGMDLSIIAQLRGDKRTGLAIQKDMLGLQQIFRTKRQGPPSTLRVLAFAAASDMGANTPVELLLEGADVELATCYITKDHPIPHTVPDHDVAIVVAPGTADGEETLAAVDAVLASWPRPIINLPANIRILERDALCRKLNGIPKLKIPDTARVRRKDLLALASKEIDVPAFLPGAQFPIIVRPVGSHAGIGLSLIEQSQNLTYYLAGQDGDAFFVSPFMDYSDQDGLFRKYRIAFIGGRPFASHMAISDEWKIWYASADMALSVENRILEASWMTFFEDEFVEKHKFALAEMAAKLGLDYFIIDCAETRDGELLIFEADNSAIVHDLDPPNVFPYKSVHMQRLFAAFVAMLRSKAFSGKSLAA